CCQYSSGSSF
nr:immunoglobulin light chain junction region [Macaca mulatta]MOV86032.1 immunoglobulin light chain junction region [Macaca mulatta]